MLVTWVCYKLMSSKSRHAHRQWRSSSSSSQAKVVAELAASSPSLVLSKQPTVLQFSQFKPAAAAADKK
jgi:hypothetical protein